MSTEDAYDGWAAIYDHMFVSPEHGINEARQSVVRLLRKLVPQGKVLEAGCGTGLPAAALAEAGYEVTGIDLSAASLAEAEKLFAARDLKGTFRKQDLLHMNYEAAFDAILGLSSLLSHFPNGAPQKLLLAQLTVALKPGGVLILGNNDYETLLAREPDEWVSPARLVARADGPTLYIQQRRWSGRPRKRQHTSIDRLILPDGTLRTTTLTRYAVTQTEITEMLTDLGFRDIRWLPPARTGFYQPLCLALKPEEKERQEDAPAVKAPPEIPRLAVHRTTGSKEASKRKTLIVWRGDLETCYTAVRFLEDRNSDVILHRISRRVKEEAPGGSNGSDMDHEKLLQALEMDCRPFEISGSAIDLSGFSEAVPDAVSTAYLAAQAAMTHRLEQSDLIVLPQESDEDFGWDPDNADYRDRRKRALEMLKSIMRSEEPPQCFSWAPPPSEAMMREYLDRYPTLRASFG